MRFLWFFLGWLLFALMIPAVIILCSEYVLWRERRRKKALSRELDACLREWTKA